MKRIILLICAMLFIQLGQAASERMIICENLWAIAWSGATKGIKCIMKHTTTIDSDDFSISPLPTASGLYFDGNKKVLFLPIKIDEALPNLKQYDARDCSLKTVSKVHFKNLKKLQLLDLAGNQIEIIYSNTFEDLTSLKTLDLKENKIQQMNGAVFGGLNKLKEVWLNGNICINKEYHGATEIAKAVREVNESCKFTEPDITENRELSNEVATLKTKLATAESLNLQSELTIQKLSNEVAAMKKQLHGLVSNGLTS